MTWTIPPNPTSDKLQAATFYRDQFGWTVHPLASPNDKNVPPKSRGKMPIIDAWPRLMPEVVTDDYLHKYWGNGSNHNLGVVVRPPHVVVDLDSKSDNGASVRLWLGQQAPLQAVPRERTGGGCHLHFICQDLPGFSSNGKAHGKALSAKINDGVTAELFFNGQNIVLAPSQHASGTPYNWEVTGQIPAVTWEELQEWFRFIAPGSEKKEAAGKKLKKAAAWWTRFEGNLATLDIIKLTKSLGIYGEPVGSVSSKHSVLCPWRDQHSDHSPDNSPDSSAVVFEAADGKWPGFKCLHASHGEKSFQDFLVWCEAQKAGVVDEHCARKRIWDAGTVSESGKTQVPLPGPNRLDSEFAKECGKIIGPKQVWFRKGKFVVEVRQSIFNESIHHLSFHQLRSIEVRSGIEDHIEVGTTKDDGSGKPVFTALSMSDSTAAMLINSPQLQRELPLITRIAGYRMPLLMEGQFMLTQPGFDPVSGLYTDPNAPVLIEDMDRPTALMWLRELTEGFCFDGPQSVTHFIARLLTPLCHGIMGWDQRGPFWIFTANRERLGKDYMAGIAGLLFDGHTNEDAPLEPHNVTETRKRITSALMAGRGRMHFANCSGFIDDAGLEAAITSQVWGDRVLGSNTDISLPNEIEFSMSGNMGVITYRGDLAHRARHIRLTYAQENPNQRQFKNPLLHQWVFQHRSDLLSALIALIKHWFDTGCAKGTTPFASFPKWAEVMGGIMRANDLGDPCLPEEMSTVGGNEEERDMKTLFTVAHAKFGTVGVELKKIIALIKSDDTGSQLFGWLNLAERSGETGFGKMLRRYVGRIFDGIILKVYHQGRRPKFAFEQFDTAQKGAENPVDGVFGPAKGRLSGDIGNIGNVLYSMRGDSVVLNNDMSEGEIDIQSGDGLENVANVTKVTTSYDLVTEPTAFPAIAQAIANTSEAQVALDIETYGKNALNPFQGDIRLLSLCLGQGTRWLIDLKATGYDLGSLKPALESALLVGHNIKFDLRWLLHKCGLKANRVFCTMTASRLLAAGRKELKHDLTTVVDRHLQLTLPPDCSCSDWGAAQLTTQQYQYAASDIIHLADLKTVLDQEIADNRLSETASLEMALIPVVVEMEETGFQVDTTKLRQLKESHQAEEVTAQAAVLVAFDDPNLNPNSVPQVKAAFQKLGVEIDSTNAETLANVGHPAAKALLESRGATKQLGLITTLLNAVEADGRIHGSFNPTGTDTGRFSSSKPNLQNISRGEVRSCFIASPGCKLVVADYSQIELRALAAIASESRMLEAYGNHEDLHRKTAAIILDKASADVSKEDRQLAKPVNFGLIYGQGAEGLVRYAKTNYHVTFSLEEANAYRNRFFAEYEGLAQWHQDARRLAEGEATETRTRLGRRQLLPDRTEYWKRFTRLVNTPVQGGSADGLKRAMVELSKKLPIEARIISTVHDELIVEVPEAEAEAVKQLVATTMTETMAGIFAEVPIEVEAKVCSNWGEK